EDHSQGAAAAIFADRFLRVQLTDEFHRSFAVFIPLNPHLGAGGPDEGEAQTVHHRIYTVRNKHIANDDGLNACPGLEDVSHATFSVAQPYADNIPLSAQSARQWGVIANAAKTTGTNGRMCRVSEYAAAPSSLSAQ